MPILDHFGIIAPFYDRVMQVREPEKMLKRLGMPVQGRVLDAGGGTGRIGEMLRGYAGQVVVADLSLRMLLQASSKTGLDLACTHTERLPFAEGTFDRVVMVDALHHVCDHQETAGELMRVLKPGGRIVIEEPDVRKLSIKLLALGEKLMLMRSHFISPPKIAALFPDANDPIRIVKDGYNAFVIIEKA